MGEQNEITCKLKTFSFDHFNYGDSVLPAPNEFDFFRSKCTVLINYILSLKNTNTV